MPLGNEPDIRQFEKLLRELKSSASLSHYSLTLFCREKGVRDGPAAPFAVCCSVNEDQLCRALSRQFFENDLESYFSEMSPAVRRYGGGFFGFVVPFRLGRYEFCLVGDGVRDESIDLWQLVTFSRQGGSEALSMLPHLEQIGTATYQQVDELAREVAERIRELRYSDAPPSGEAVVSAQADSRLVAVARTLELLEESKTIAATVALCCETIGESFDVEKLVVALRETSGTRYELIGVRGLPDDLGTVSGEAIALFLSGGRTMKAVPYDERMRAVLPAIGASMCACFPLHSQGESLGFIALIDCELQERELLLVSMLTNATAGKVSRLLKEAEQSKAAALSGRFMSLANTLLQVENKEQLYEAILGVALDLIDATQGSVILVDMNGESMHIVFTRGMTLNIARSLSLKVGKGIAGRVAQTGEPLLVNDVERDSRVAMINRARFKTKSLLCVPLKLKDKIIGVLNLSDKKNLAPFCQDDLQLLTSFANLASLMIERTLVLEQSVRFEQLSVTDSLTGLYNRRFLKGRLEEELNRSSRQGLNLTILFIDLDFFKSYNDACGHLAGDQALKKTADIIRASLRDMDVVARYGGEEFCAVLPGTSKEEALVVAERIRAEIERERFSGESDIPPRRITASLGVASFPEDGRTFTELIHASDVALYQAKAKGRNCIVAANNPASSPTPETSSATGTDAAEPLPAKTLDFNAFLETSAVNKAEAPKRK